MSASGQVNLVDTCTFLLQPNLTYLPQLKWCGSNSVEASNDLSQMPMPQPTRSFPQRGALPLQYLFRARQIHSTYFFFG